MEGQFGPYPYGSELRVLTAPTYWNGFEHPGNIVLADTLKHQIDPGYADNVAHTLDHEMTHMWAGNQTTLSGTYDFAWKESMAEYLPFTYEATVDEAVATRNAAAWKSEAHAATYWPVPDDMPTLFDYYGDVYGAGPMVLFRQLEALTSRAQVIAAIQSTIGSPHALSIDELVAALSASTGLDLTAYSQQWIHGTGTPVWPQIAVTYDQTAGTLAIHQTNQAAGVRGCAFHVGLYAAPGTPGEVDIAVDTFHDGPDQTIPVTDPGFTVVNTGLDPQNECLVFVPATTSARAPVHTNPWVAPRDAR
jgi:aminopeptidase N